MADMPDYVRDFPRDKSSTQIKHIHSGWYLYEVKRVRDPETGRLRKASGPIIGTITPQGLVPSRHRKKAEADVPEEQPAAAGAAPEPETTGDQPPAQEEVQTGAPSVPGPCGPVEAGACAFLHQRTKRIRTLLEKYFPDCWTEMYVLAMLTAVSSGEGGLASAEARYRRCLLPQLYPGLALDRDSIALLMEKLSQRREAAESFMKEAGAGLRNCMVTWPELLKESAPGRRSGPVLQSGRLYIFGMNAYGTAVPAFCRLYDMDTPAAEAAAALLRETGDAFGPVAAAGDRNAAGQALCRQMTDAGLDYVFTLERGSRETAGKIPASFTGYDSPFAYRNKGLMYHVIPKRGRRVVVYLDFMQLNDEAVVIVDRNNEMSAARMKEMEEIISGLEESITRAQNEGKQALEGEAEALRQAADLQAAGREELRRQAMDRARDCRKEAARAAAAEEQAREDLETARQHVEYLRAWAAAANSGEQSENRMKARNTDWKTPGKKVAGRSLPDRPDYENITEETGTTAVVTSLVKVPGDVPFRIIKVLESAEKMIGAFDAALEPDIAFLGDSFNAEAWTLLSHVAALLAVPVYNELSIMKRLRGTACREVLEQLSSIHAVPLPDGSGWAAEPLSEDQSELCQNLGFDPERIVLE